MRCFVFGLMGVIPLFGMGMACLALLLRRELAEETGEPLHLTWANHSSTAAFFLAVILLACGQDGLVLALGILLAALQAGLLFGQYRRIEPLEWNPARHLVWWGAGLAYAGLILSSLVLLLNVGSALRRI
jgi:hypothetical protein